MRRFPHSELKEFKILKKLDSPQKIQDFLDTLPFNFEKNRETNRSPFMTLTAGTAHCMEGAMLAAAAFWYHGGKPLLLDLKTKDARDFDHVVAPFKIHGLWGAISKTNHAVLRYRDPIYRDIRELVMSYFNEYFLDDGKKTLRSHSTLFDLSTLGTDWLTSKKNLWNVAELLDRSPHVNILKDKRVVKDLRRANRTEIEAGKIIEWKK